MAWNTALLTGLAMNGKLRPFEETFTDAEVTDGSHHLLSALFKMKRRGVEMTIERITRH